LKVNLKKAAALSAALSSVAVRFDHQYAVDIYSDPVTDAAVAVMHQQLEQQVRNALIITDMVFGIRQMIGAANVAKINTLLTERAKIEKQLTVLNTLPVRAPGTNLVVLGRQLEAAKAAEPKVYGGNRIPPLELETASIVQPFASTLRRRKRNLDEELQALNFNTTIELPDDVVKVLTDLDLI
jgi:hypothetical protein